ncbi:hypothetical protein ADUPG1_010321 [Aduncisulcus paluster]|uniref:Uncharacterized protein n=1 Tax=Aduncisulcus paluster TaxID=2918883 RepID=A0ABQ5JQW7_9EUKA|nr:hypothetical protein ADUPG1_010321 [Aduncisulcus paluster]
MNFPCKIVSIGSQYLKNIPIIDSCRIPLRYKELQTEQNLYQIIDTPYDPRLLSLIRQNKPGLFNYMKIPLEEPSNIYSIFFKLFWAGGVPTALLITLTLFDGTKISRPVRFPEFTTFSYAWLDCIVDTDNVILVEIRTVSVLCGLDNGNFDGLKFAKRNILAEIENTATVRDLISFFLSNMNYRHIDGNSFVKIFLGKLRKLLPSKLPISVEFFKFCSRFSTVLPLHPYLGALLYGKNISIFQSLDEHGIICELPRLSAKKIRKGFRKEYFIDITSQTTYLEVEKAFVGLKAFKPRIIIECFHILVERIMWMNYENIFRRSSWKRKK